MIKSAIFIAKQLRYNTSSICDVLYKIGMYTAFMKDYNTSYDFGGKILHEDNDIVIFAGKPKRITIENDDMTEIVEVEITDNYIGMFQVIKQFEVVHFEKDCFSVSGEKYYTLDDLKDIYMAYVVQTIA